MICPYHQSQPGHHKVFTLALFSRGVAELSLSLVGPCQVWNTNSHSGVVAAFNLQGASWSRRERKYVLHDRHPATLTTGVTPLDVHSFQVCSLPREALSLNVQ